MAHEVTGGEPSVMISAIVVRSGKLALVAGGPARWLAHWSVALRWFVDDPLSRFPGCCIIASVAEAV